MAAPQRIYARALFEAAKERGRLEPVRRQLEAFVRALREVPELAGALRNPQLDPLAKAAVLDELLGDADELVRNFLRLVAEKGRSGEIEEIVREYEALAAAEEGVLNVELATAVELSEKEASSIVRRIEQAAGRAVEASRKVEPGLIGGVVVQVGSLRLDASVRGRLQRLRHALETRSPS